MAASSCWRVSLTHCPEVWAANGRSEGILAPSERFLRGRVVEWPGQCSGLFHHDLPSVGLALPLGLQQV
jgi:hypothetical protein